MPGETLLNQRYELVAQQGSGGMSVIYRALDRMLGRMVAIKILRPNLTKDPAFLEKFQQEARSVAMMAATSGDVLHTTNRGAPAGFPAMVHPSVIAACPTHAAFLGWNGASGSLRTRSAQVNIRGSLVGLLMVRTVADAGAHAQGVRAGISQPARPARCPPSGPAT